MMIADRRSRFFFLLVTAVSWSGLAAQPPADPLDGRQGRNLALGNFRPRAMLKVEEHDLGRARFPVVDVHTHFPIRKGIFGGITGLVRAVDGVSLRIEKGEILGLVGESGCGKSTLSRTIMQLQPATSGEISLEEQNLSTLEPSAIQRRRLDFQMIFQDPYASLNPRMTVYSALAEALFGPGNKLAQRHLGIADDAERDRIVLADVGLAIGDLGHGFAIRNGGDVVGPGEAGADAQHQIGLGQEVGHRGRPRQGAGAERQGVVLGKRALGVEGRHHRHLQQRGKLL